MALAGHLNEILPGVPRTPTPRVQYYIITGLRVDTACLPSRQSFTGPALAGRPSELLPPGAATQLVSSVLAASNIILYYSVREDKE